MIKAIFFDLYNTLVTYDPPREETHINLLKKHGINLTKKAISPAIKAGDEYFYRENSQSLVKNRAPEEQKQFWYDYEVAVLNQAGIEPEPDLVNKVLQDLGQVKYKMAPFNDVLPVLENLKLWKYKLGIISNIDRDINPMCKEMGFSPYLEIILTSHQTGLYKPSPEIFQLACQTVDVNLDQAIYVGDQYQIDVVGANRAGMTGILVDRDQLVDEDLPEGYRISSMSDLPLLVSKIASA
ncbi:MAG: HAD family hydrolase [Dehalococcoidales bacterium]|nr:HAD family hydrolase [Dehalococcoidales bacterium]MDX9986690.1 HAD family hydrolase [Dehalococcoidales bacterium]NLE89767.1 HAD family hydrolase [Dehalococcoidales bacterium]